MKAITIQSLDLVNFKGVKSLHVDFGGTLTTISGRNGSGKTTVFDAFTWVLFGKDSRDRKDFGIKTYGPDGRTIDRLPHEVTCVLLVSGERVELRRCYCEKWTKRHGSATEEFTGHEEERYVNDVPCSLKDYQSKVAAICDETVFKFITNPLYFTSQKADLQRQMLFRMAGEVSDRQVAEGNEDFTGLLDRLTGKTLAEYRREIQARKRQLKASIEGIPGRIEERRRDMPEECDWAGLEDELKAVRSEMDGYDRQLSDINEMVRAESARIQARLDRETEVRSAIAARRLELERSLMAGYYESADRRKAKEGDIEAITKRMAVTSDAIGASEKKRAVLEAERRKLLEEWKSIRAERLTFDESQFVCPTCGREYGLDEIGRMRERIAAQWNEARAQKLERNERQGLDVKDRITKENEGLAKLRGMYEDDGARLKAAEDELASMASIERPDLEGAYAGDAAIAGMELKLRELEAGTVPAAGNGSDEINARKADAMCRISALERALGTRGVMEANLKRIGELEDMLRAQSQELALLEGEESTIAAFSRAKTDAVEGRINAMFGTVRFRMFDTQINGGEVETCEATVGGVPFSDLNSAGRINAGLDIINAICRSEGMCAPIFIDNSESVLSPARTEGQQVHLVAMDCNFNVNATA